MDEPCAGQRGQRQGEPPAHQKGWENTRELWGVELARRYESVCHSLCFYLAFDLIVQRAALDFINAVNDLAPRGNRKIRSAAEPPAAGLAHHPIAKLGPRLASEYKAPRLNPRPRETPAMKAFPARPPLAAILFGVLTTGAAFGAGGEEQAFNLHPGQELTFAVKVADGKVTLGPPRTSRLGAAKTASGEITVGLSPRDATQHEQVTVAEKTPVPIDFLATALVGATKIDEAVLCGRLDAPSSAHIGAISWRVSLHAFEARKDGATCE